VRRCPAAGLRGEILGDEQGQPLALQVHAPLQAGPRRSRTRGLHERPHLILRQPHGADDRRGARARCVHGEAPEAVSRLHGLAAPADTSSSARPSRRRLRYVHVQIDLAATLHQAGDSERAGALAGEALALALASADPRGQAQAHNLLGVLARGGADLGGAAAHLEHSLVLARELGDDAAQAAALNNLALVRRDAGELEQARELTRLALDLCVATGDRHREAALENNLADIDHAAGDGEASMEHLKRAVSIFAEVEADDATRMPEIWKLVSW